MANKISNPDKSVLENLYFNRGMTQQEIGNHFSVSQKVVHRWFKTVGIKARVAAKRNQKGENNHMWKGEKASYSAFHFRVRNERGNANRCENCGREDDGIKYDWANISGKYHDTQDYKMLCRSCHFKMDGHKNNFPNRREKKLTNKSKTINK